MMRIEHSFFLVFVFLFAIGVLGSIFGIAIFASRNSFGCYQANGVDFCDHWHEKSVEFVKYEDMTQYIITNCSCGLCINTDSCNCKYVSCYLIGEYDNNDQCKITYDYTNVGNYEKIWTYDDILKYEIGTFKDYYINSDKFSGYCMPTSSVESIGNESYIWFVVMCVGLSCVVIAIACMYVLHRIENYNNKN
jgi:hypothetical protein